MFTGDLTSECAYDFSYLTLYGWMGTFLRHFSFCGSLDVSDGSGVHFLLIFVGKL